MGNNNYMYIKETSIEEIENREKDLSFVFPDDFKDFVLKNNGGRPINKIFYLLNGEQKEFNKLFSFNINDKDNVILLNNFESKHKDKLISIANDPSGNLICYERDSKNLVYLDLEMDEYLFLESKWSEFNNHFIDLDSVDINEELSKIKNVIDEIEGYRFIYDIDSIFPKYIEIKSNQDTDKEHLLSTKYILYGYIDELSVKVDNELNELALINDVDLKSYNRLFKIKQAISTDSVNKDYFLYRIKKLEKKFLSDSNKISDLISKIDEEIEILELEDKNSD